MTAAEHDLREREEALARERRELERSRKHVARDALLEARSDVERAIAEARAGREREARRALEQEIAALASEQRKIEGSRDGGMEKAEPSAPIADLSAIAKGTKVRIISLGVDGEFDSVQGVDVAVKVRGRRVRVRANDVSFPSLHPSIPPSPAS